MNPSKLHHPDINLTLLKRRTAEALVDFLAWYGQSIVTRGRSWTWSRSFPSRTAVDAAAYRLRKAGVICYRRGKDGSQVLSVAADAPVDEGLRNPERRWRERWDGWWYVLMYDVPESQRVLRDGLRRVLNRARLGCLQKSVWISPRDIRPFYDDLVRTGGLDFVSYLLEARNVLGRSAQDLVRQAWDFEAINSGHRWYLRRYETQVVGIARHNTASPEAIAALAREELAAYRRVMEKDPLLPSALLPPQYLGRDVVRLHRRFVRTTARQLTRG